MAKLTNSAVVHKQTGNPFVPVPAQPIPSSAIVRMKSETSRSSTTS